MFKALSTLLVVFAVATATPLFLRPHRGSNHGRIVGGENTTIESHPYQVSLLAYGSHGCGGSIISKEWVVTAGHCVDGLSPADSGARAGSALHNRGGSIHRAVEIVRHERYGSDSHGSPIHDIAVVRIEPPFEFDETRQPIPLFHQDEEALPGAMTSITGWGNTFMGYPDVLQHVSVPIVSKAQCNDNYASFGGIPENQICAAYPEGGKDACQGDSGGPLAIDGRLAGVVSWGFGCAKPGYPGVYTEIAAYRTWIQTQTGV